MLFSIISQAQDRTPDEIIAARYRVLATKQAREQKEKDLELKAQEQRSIECYKVTPEETKNSISYVIKEYVSSSELYSSEYTVEVGPTSRLSFIGENKVLLDLEGKRKVYILDTPGTFEVGDYIGGDYYENVKSSVATNCVTGEEVTISTDIDESYYRIDFNGRYIKLYFVEE